MSDIKQVFEGPVDITVRAVLLRLDITLLEAVDKAAERRGIARSVFIRKALERVVAGEPQ